MHSTHQCFAFELVGLRKGKKEKRKQERLGQSSSRSGQQHTSARHWLQQTLPS